MVTDEGRQSSHLYNLPDETLAAICRQIVDTDSLYCLAMTSRPLHNRCLPLYLSRHGIADPTLFCDLYIPPYSEKRFDALSGMQSALHVSSINHLSCTFPFMPDNELHLIFRHMRRLLSVVSRMTHLNTVTLYFDPVACCCRKPQLDSVLSNWSMAISSLLNTIFQKGCISLTIIGMRYMVHTYNLYAFSRKQLWRRFKVTLRNITKRVKQPPISKSNVLRGDDWEFRRSDSTVACKINLPEFSTEARSVSVMQTFNIGSTGLLFPPTLQWTYSALLYSPIRSLILSNLNVNDIAWPPILELLAHALPNLSELTLSNVSYIYRDDLIRFLNSFQRLSSLSIDYNVGDAETDGSSPLPCFPHLTSLNVSAGWILNWPMKPHPFPLLNDLSVSYRRRAPMVISPIVQIFALLKSSHLNITPNLVIIAGLYPWSWMRREVEEPFPEEAACTSRITNLTLILDRECAEDFRFEHAFHLWLAMFAFLKSLAFRGQNRVLKHIPIVTLVGRAMLNTSSPFTLSIDGEIMDMSESVNELLVPD